MLSSVIESILRNVLQALYEPFWVALLMAVLIMFVYKQNTSIREAVLTWLGWFRKDRQFRRLFALTLYICLILFRTLLNRSYWKNPLSNVIGVWGLYIEKNGEYVLTTEAPENIILFIPFTILLFWAVKERVFKGAGKITLGRILISSCWISFLFSFAIEMTQLLIRVGTWQLSDLAHNTIGGICGGLVYWILWNIHKLFVTERKM